MGVDLRTGVDVHAAQRMEQRRYWLEVDERPDGFTVGDSPGETALPVGQVVKAELRIPPRFVMHVRTRRLRRKDRGPKLDPFD